MARKRPAPELVRNVRALFGNDRARTNLKPIKKCLAVRHVAFEDLGLLGPLVSSRGYGVRYHDAGVQPIDAETLLAPDLLIVLGGPIGVYETDTYPFIAGEIAAIAVRLSAGRPTLGICLGAQMMAAALGARVAPGAGQGDRLGAAATDRRRSKIAAGAARHDAGAALARGQLRIARRLHQACLDAALPRPGLHGRARATRLAISS
jgi:putative intracellular protease/amidase